MKQQYKSGAVAAAPPVPAAPSVGNPTEGDVANGVAATVIGAHPFYQLFKELEAVVADGGLQPDANVLTQVRDALRAKYVAKDDAAQGGVTGATDAKAAAYAVTAGDDGKTIEVNANAAPRTITLPDLDDDADGFTVTVMKTDASANQVVVDGNGNDTINGGATYELKDRWESAIFKWTGTAWIAIGGASTAWVRSFFSRFPVRRLHGEIRLPAGVRKTFDLTRALNGLTDIAPVYDVDSRRPLFADSPANYLRFPPPAQGVRTDTLYAVLSDGSDVQLYSVNADTGALTAIGAQQQPAGNVDFIQGLDIAEHLGSVYVVIYSHRGGAPGTPARRGRHFFSINLGSGALTQILSDTENVAGIGVPAGLGSFGGALYEMAAPDQRRTRLYSVNPGSGVLTDIGVAQQPPDFTAVHGLDLAVHGGSLVALISGARAGGMFASRLHAVSPTTGKLTPIGNLVAVANRNPSNTGLAASGGSLYGLVARTTNVVRLYSVNGASGAIASIGTDQNPAALGNIFAVGLAATGAGGIRKDLLTVERLSDTRMAFTADLDTTLKELLGYTA